MQEVDYVNRFTVCAGPALLAEIPRVETPITIDRFYALLDDSEERAVGKATNGEDINDSNTKILELVDFRRFQGFELVTWPHERPKPWFASHRLLLDKGAIYLFVDR